MLYYWQTKYTTLIYIPFFIFPHNRHFFVHISPSLLEVWIFPCGRTPFQLPEDTVAQLSGGRRSSRNVGLAPDSSQNQRECNRWVPDQDCFHNTEAFLKWWLFAELYGLQSVNVVSNGHKFSDTLSFQSSPKLHCALFQILLQLRSASHVCFP